MSDRLEAFNRRDFEAMTKYYADSIAWTDHTQGRTFRTPQEFKDDFLAGWAVSSSDIQITGPRYINAGQTGMCAFTAAGAHDGPLGPFPGTGKAFALPLCEGRCRCVARPGFWSAGKRRGDLGA